MAARVRQLELDLAPPGPDGADRWARGRALARRLPAAALGLAPVWLALAVFAQVSLGGLRPALAESRRLAREEARLEQRMGSLVPEHRALLLRERALADPIFRERVRRARRSAANAGDGELDPLSLPLTIPGG